MPDAEKDAGRQYAELVASGAIIRCRRIRPFGAETPCACADECSMDKPISLPVAESDAAPSYHDLHITTADLPRTSIFNLPYGYEVSCTRVGGWSVWFNGERVGGEYDEGLRLDVAGHVVCDSLIRVLPPGVDQ